MRSWRAITWAVVAVGLCTLAGVVAAVRHVPAVRRADDIPTGHVKREDLDMKIYAAGELRASHSEVLTAPPIGGGTLQLIRLLPTGSSVKKGDVVMEFDPSEQRYKLEQSRSELLQAEQEITKAEDDAAVVAAQDKVALLKARFDVRRAELQVQENELVSAIDARKNDLLLEQAKRVQAELEQDVKSRSVSGHAAIALAQEKRNKAKLAMDQAQHNIEKMRVVAPMDGLVALEKNEGATGGIFFSGMSLPEYHEGDQVQPGRTVGEVIDPKEMELAADVGELERNSVREGEPVAIRLDALPDSALSGTVKTLGGVNNRRFWGDNSRTKFEITIALTTKDSRLRPGLTAQIVISGEPRKNALCIPREAVFLKDGKRVVYVRKGNAFEPHEVTIRAENEGRAAIEGISAGSEIALADPIAPRIPKAPSPGIGG